MVKLLNDEIHLYFSYPGQISDPGLLSRYESLLSNGERAQMARFYYPDHRHQYLITRALVRTSLSAYYPVSPAEWKFGKNHFGKPEISHPDGIFSIRFNLSHANGLVICGTIRKHEIGVDVEDVHRSTQAALGKLSSYFSTQEVEDLQELPPEKQKERFFDYWTLKESYIKARGLGFSIPLNKFSFHFQDNRLKSFSVHPDLKDDAKNWQFWRIPITERYRAALAIQSENSDFKIKAFNSVPLQSNQPIRLHYL